MIDQKAIKRFERKILKPDDTDCWLWTDTPTKDGYGRFYYKGRCIGINIMSWMIYKGNAPKKRIVVRKCNNLLCVNPDHLYLANRSDYITSLKKKRTKKRVKKPATWQEKVKRRLTAWCLFFSKKNN